MTHFISLNRCVTCLEEVIKESTVCVDDYHFRGQCTKTYGIGFTCISLPGGPLQDFYNPS